MARPHERGDRVQMQLRMPEELRDRLHAAASEREVSANYLANRALEDFLSRLIPPNEIQWTRHE